MLDVIKVEQSSGRNSDTASRARGARVRGRFGNSDPRANAMIDPAQKELQSMRLSMFPLSLGLLVNDDPRERASARRLQAYN